MDLFSLLSASQNDGKGAKFVSLRNNVNEYGEVTNYLINLHCDRAAAKQHDIDFLTKKIEENQFENEIVRQAYVEVLEGLVNPNRNRSNGQINAFERIQGFPIERSVKTGELYIVGQRVRKTILKEGNYPPDTRRPLTKEKDKVRKILKSTQIRRFKVGRQDNIRIKGRIIEL